MKTLFQLSAPTAFYNTTGALVKNTFVGVFPSGTLVKVIGVRCNSNFQDDRLIVSPVNHDYPIAIRAIKMKWIEDIHPLMQLARIAE